jgi:hypothetical protein
MSIRVFTTTGRNTATVFDTVEAAEEWLRRERYVARRNQPGQWVHSRLEGNLFASVINENDAPAWTPNFGKPGAEVLAEAKVMADRIDEVVRFEPTPPAVIDRLVNKAVKSTFAEAVDEFRAVQREYAKFGAADTEPNEVFALMLRDVSRKAHYWVPATAREWELYAVPGAGKAAKELRRAASRACSAGKRERMALGRYVRELVG